MIELGTGGGRTIRFQRPVECAAAPCGHCDKEEDPHAPVSHHNATSFSLIVEVRITMQFDTDEKPCCLHSKPSVM